MNFGICKIDEVLISNLLQFSLQLSSLFSLNICVKLVCYSQWTDFILFWLISSLKGFFFLIQSRTLCSLWWRACAMRKRQKRKLTQCIAHRCFCQDLVHLLRRITTFVLCSQSPLNLHHFCLTRFQIEGWLELIGTPSVDILHQSDCAWLCC